MEIIDNRDQSDATVSSYYYTHDALGRRTSRTQSGSAIGVTSMDDFNYNKRSEVESSSNNVDVTAAWNPTFDYDQIGNRLTSTGFIDSSYTANELNQYSEIHHSSLILHPSFDADGNLTDSGTGWTYSWNAENRLIQATDGSVTIDFTYDYQGRLVKKDDGTDVKVYVYDDWNRIATFLHTSALTLHNSYLWGLDLSGSMQGAGGVGGLLREGNLYPLFDANGNIMQKLNGAGSVEMNVAYDPFGNIISGTLVGEYAFSTKPLIDGLNWYYYGFRYYDPVTGRWASRDPIEEEGGLNLYGFVGNDGVNAWDYLGLSSNCCGGKPLPRGRECCNDLPYNPKTQDCCGGQVLHPRAIFCCKDNEIVRKRPRNLELGRQMGRWYSQRECVADCIASRNQAIVPDSSQDINNPSRIGRVGSGLIVLVTFSLETVICGNYCSEPICPIN